MGALRKAGVWLGLIEDEDDRYSDRGYDSRGYDDDYDEDEDEVVPVRSRTPRASESVRESLRESRADPVRTELSRSEPSRTDSLRTESPRSESARLERPTVRPLARPATSPENPASAYPTRDNLALAPQVHLRERAVAEPEERRYQITTLHPTTYTEARTIGEHFRDGVPVIMNLTEMAEADARRLVDFAAGLAFGLRGSMERVTNRVFLLSPANVQVTEEDRLRIAEGGFFNQS